MIVASIEFPGVPGVIPRVVPGPNVSRNHVSTDAQSRHKAYLRGSSKVLEALSLDAPKSLEDLAVLPEKRRALLAMLPAIRQRHRFHLQVSLQGCCQPVTACSACGPAVSCTSPATLSGKVPSLLVHGT